MLLVKGVKTVSGFYRTGQSDVSKLRGAAQGPRWLRAGQADPKMHYARPSETEPVGPLLVIEQPFPGCYHPYHETKGLFCVLDLDVWSAGSTLPMHPSMHSPPCITGPAGRQARQAGRQTDGGDSRADHVSFANCATKRNKASATHRLRIQSWASWLAHRELKRLQRSMVTCFNPGDMFRNMCQEQTARVGR